jgi:leucyl aminopeptidase (aminopeptidase T)
VKDGQIVLVTGDVHALDFLEELSVAVARHGGSPLQTVTRERMALRLYEEVPEKFDKKRQAAAVALAELVDAIVKVESREEPDLLRGIPAARVAAATKTDTDVTNILRDRSVPLLIIGNGLWPTAAAARVHGVSVAELTRIFWSALAVTPDELRQAGGAVKDAIGAGKQVRVTHPNGTDLTFSVEERPVLVSDGTTSPESLSDNVVETHLPAGEVLVVPVRDSANGRVVVGRMPFEGGWLEQFSLEFKQGRVVRHQGKPTGAYKRFQQLYAAAPKIGRDEFALLDIGVNRGARASNGNALLSSIPAGTVTVGIGNNTRGGGETDIPFSFVAPLAGATVTVDDRAIVEKGELVTGPPKPAPKPPPSTRSRTKATTR